MHRTFVQMEMTLAIKGIFRFNLYRLGSIFRFSFFFFRFLKSKHNKMQQRGAAINVEEEEKRVTIAVPDLVFPATAKMKASCLWMDVVLQFVLRYLCQLFFCVAKVSRHHTVFPLCARYEFMQLNCDTIYNSVISFIFSPFSLFGLFFSSSV